MRELFVTLAIVLLLAGSRAFPEFQPHFLCLTLLFIAIDAVPILSNHPKAVAYRAKWQLTKNYIRWALWLNGILVASIVWRLALHFFGEG